MKKDAPESLGEIYRMPLTQLHPHPENPFAVRDDLEMNALVDSIRESGVLVPAIARPLPNGGYELISGHRRKYASEVAGLDSMPVVICNLTDDEARILLVDCNIQRENILPSERARAYTMLAIMMEVKRPIRSSHHRCQRQDQRVRPFRRNLLYQGAGAYGFCH